MKRVKKWLALMLAATMLLPSGITAKAAETVDAGLTVEARYNSNHIRWNEVEGATSYNVLREEGDGTFTSIQSGTTATDCIDTSAGTGTQYKYKVEVVMEGSTVSTDLVSDTYPTGVEAVQEHAKAEQLHLDFSTIEDGRKFDGSRVYNVDTTLVNKIKGLVNGSVLISFNTDNTITRQESLFVAKADENSFDASTGLAIFRNSNSRIRVETKGGLKFDQDYQNIVADKWNTVNFKINGNNGATVLNESTERGYTNAAYAGLFSGITVDSITIGAQTKNGEIVSGTSFKGKIAYVTVTDEVLSLTEAQAYNKAVNESLLGSATRKALQTKIDELANSGNTLVDEEDFNAKLEAARVVVSDENSTDEECQKQIDILNKITYVDYRIADDVLIRKAYANSYDKNGTDGNADWAFDDEDHVWHQNYTGNSTGEGTTEEVSDDNPIYIQTGFGEAKYVTRLTCRPRSSEGDINKYTISVANLSDPDNTPSEDD